jgi:hypothetical protein
MVNRLLSSTIAFLSYIGSGPAKGLEGSRYGKTDNGDLTAIMAEVVDGGSQRVDA